MHMLSKDTNANTANVRTYHHRFIFHSITGCGSVSPIYPYIDLLQLLIVFFFFCVPMILASCQIWSPGALINSTVCVRLYSVPFSLSSRVDGFGQVCCLSSAWSGQSWRMCSAVWAILPHGQLGLVPILNFVCMCLLRRLCPDRWRNIMVWPSLLSLWYASVLE